MTDDWYVMVAFRPSLTLAVLDGEPPEGITVEGITYVDAGFGDWCGFYDWLRSETGALVGVRSWPDEACAVILEKVEGLPYVEVDRDLKNFSIWFTDDRKLDPEASASQNFGDNRVMGSPTGEYAMSFGTAWLSDADYDTLRKLALGRVPMGHSA
ncbi:MAG: hypothetical protein ACRDI2_00175 [Chloroflexota bacterium]